MKLTPQQIVILGAVMAGAKITRIWRGSKRSGRLSHTINGESVLEKNVRTLQRLGYLKPAGISLAGRFAPYVWSGKSLETRD